MSSSGLQWAADDEDDDDIEVNIRSLKGNLVIQCYC
jgi:hypothetical protein